MRRVFILLVLMLTVWAPNAKAHVDIDGIPYTFFNHEARVEFDPNKYYTGDIVIPESLVYEGETYTVTSIEERAFYNGSGVTSVTLPCSMKSIGKEAFCDCRLMTSINLPDGVTSIREGAFHGCESLTEITIPNSITVIKETVFQSCKGLKSVTIPNSVTEIKGFAFDGCESLTEITIPGSVTSIGNSAFSGCSSLTEIIIPASVTSIGNSAFSGCSSLAEVVIPASVTSIGGGLFINCNGLTSIKVESGNTVYDSRGDCNAIITTATNELIAGCVNTVIPDGITSIGNGAFSGYTGLVSVTIPDGVTSIGDNAFSYCTNLASVAFPNSLTSIWNDTFRGCTGLTEITIPKSVISIRNGTFARCTGLTSIKVESGNLVYDSRGDCNAIITMSTNELIVGCVNTVIPTDVTSIGDVAFCGCSGLTAITIPDGVTSIGNAAFQVCPDLVSVIIPNSVKSIGLGAFSDCSSLTKVYSMIEDPFELNYAFSNLPRSATLYVPIGTKEKYEATKGWTVFDNIEEREMAGIDEASLLNEKMINEKRGGVYDLSGRKINAQGTIHNAQLKKGIYIRDGRKIVVK